MRQFLRRTAPLGLAGAFFITGGLTPGAFADPKKASAQPAPAPLDPQRDTPGLAVGDAAPDAELVNKDGETVRLAHMYREHGPVVLTFYRGGWCPFCTRALKSWQGRISELEALGASFVAISPETTEHQLKTTADLNFDGFALSDPDGEAMRLYRLAFELDSGTRTRYEGFGIDLGSHNASGRWELPATATYIIDSEGVVRWVHANWDYKERAEPDAVLEALRDMQD